MTTLVYLHQIVLPAAYAMLPPKCRSDQATAMLLAIALQESKTEHRRQMGNGPARGWWQFERTGVAGVLSHQASLPLVSPVLDTLGYAGTASACHVAIEHNDILAAVFARALLWTLPARLPARGEDATGYGQYLAAWRPGKPRPTDWPGNFRTAWELVQP